MVGQHLVHPFNEDAEISVLSAMMFSKAAIENVSQILDPEDFYYERHGQIYKCALSMHLRGEAVDPLTLSEALDDKAKIHEIAAYTGATSNAAHHARIVKSKAAQRNMLRVISEAHKAAQDGDLSTAEEILADVRGHESTDLKIVTMFDAMIDLEEQIKNPPDMLGIETPLSFLKPLVGGRVYILGGYQGEGKTALAGQFVQTAAQNGKRVGFFTLEMTWRDLRDRFVSSLGVPYEQLQERRFTTDFARTAYERALMEASKWQVEMIDKGELSIADIRRVQKLREYDLIVIDHLHRFDWKERRDIERIVTGVVNVAKEYGVPVLLLAQLRRPFGTDRAPRPTMSMLRESGMIEAEAAMVAFVYRPRDDNQLRSSEAELIVAKNRYGPEDNHKLIFLGEQVRFIEPL